MKKENQRKLFAGMMLLLAFLLWTVLVRLVDVKPIGPNKSTVGFATLNGFFHGLTDVNMTLYTVTDWLGLVPIGVAFGFAILGLVQWIRRKKISKVDYSLLVLGGFYFIVIALYVLFEIAVINYRPILIKGCAEVSYPSSTTLLVTCVMTTAIMQFNSRIKHRLIKKAVAFSVTAFTLFMITGRLISGVHWISDIIGGILLSASLIVLYSFVIDFLENKLGA